MKMFKTLILLACFVTSLFSQQVTLSRVNVEGNTTTSDKMIKYSAGLRDGTQIQRSDISTAITRLWDLGLFEDVNIVLNNESQYGVEITIKVSESPILNQVLFEGMTVREARFREKLEIKSGQRIKPNSLDKASRKITEIYKEDGYFNVEVSPSVVVPQDTIVRVDYARDILFTIKENKKYQLKNIVFEGNNSFSNRKLRKELSNTKQKKWWTFWVKNYDPKTFNEDKATLTSFYQNEGHRDFRVLSDSLIVNEEDSSLSLQIKIEEGPKYYYRNFIFEGNQIAEKEELSRLLGMQSGDMYSKEQFDKSVYENMMSTYQDKGYIFSSVTPEIVPVGQDSLDVKFVFNEGNKVYVENIFVSGNEKTRENVIRRELKLYPGDVFSLSLIHI